MSAGRRPPPLRPHLAPPGMREEQGKSIPGLVSGLAILWRWAEQLARQVAVLWEHVEASYEGQPGPHAATHRPNTGRDPLPTGVPVDTFGTVAAEGTGDAFSRSTHVHPATARGAGSSSERWGEGSTAAGANATALGNGATAAFADSIAIGKGSAPYRARMAHIGTPAWDGVNFYLLVGASDVSAGGFPGAFHLRVPTASGLDQQGGDFNYEASIGTGLGVGGDHRWFVAPPGVAGSTANPLQNVMVLDGVRGWLAIGTAGAYATSPLQIASGSISLPFVLQASGYTTVDADSHVAIDTSGAPSTLNLQQIIGSINIHGRHVWLRNYASGGGNTLTISPFAGDDIEGAATLVLAADEVVHLQALDVGFGRWAVLGRSTVTGAVAGSLNVYDEGVLQGPASSMDFVGAGVTAAVAAGVATVTIAGGGTSDDTVAWMGL